MPNIQPWNIGTRPPISPIMTRSRPSDILKIWRIIKINGKEKGQGVSDDNNRKCTSLLFRKFVLQIIQALNMFWR